MIQALLKRYRSIRFYKNLLHKNDLCFDIGANIGKKSKVFLKTGAQVLAFEPQIACIPFLQKIKEKYKNFDFYTVAIDSKEGSKKLHISNHSEIATLSDTFVGIYNNELVHWTKSTMVPTLSINTAIKKYGLPNFCKIDIEGYEYEILSSLQYNIPLVEFEVIAGFQEKAIEIITLLNGENTRYNYTLNEGTNFELRSWMDIQQMSTIIRSFPKDQLHANIFIKGMVVKTL